MAISTGNISTVRDVLEKTKWNELDTSNVESGIFGESESRVLKLLLEEKDNNGFTPFALAVNMYLTHWSERRAGHVETEIVQQLCQIIDELIAKGANVETEDSKSM